LCIRAECRRGKALGEPYDGKRHVRFDEGTLETGLWARLRHRHVAKAAGKQSSLALTPPRQRPTLQTANVLNKLPNSLHAKAKRALQQIWMAETNKDALTAFDAFVDTYRTKYEKAVDCLTKDRDVLLAFYDFPAEHWTHLRTTNPIESTFATVRHRTTRSKGCLSNKTALAMVYKLVEAAQKSWRRLRGYNQLPKVIQGVKFTDGIEVVRPQAQAAA
jgi:Transposase, Mutator family